MMMMIVIVTMILSRHKLDAHGLALIHSLVVITVAGTIVAGDSLESDKKVLLSLKTHLEEQNPMNNRGRYCLWNQQKNSSKSPCNWPGISCSGGRVTAVDLRDNNIAGRMFGNFSGLTALSRLDLSGNTIEGPLPADLGLCHSLKMLNLSHNIMNGELNLTGLSSLEFLDLSTNRIFGTIQLNSPEICSSLVVANLSTNNFTGTSPVHGFDQCPNLQSLDISGNKFAGRIWPGFTRLQEFSASENLFHGELPPEIFSADKYCRLRVLDLSENAFNGTVPGEISNCTELLMLNLWGNNFTGQIPKEIGHLSSLQALYLGNNSFSRNIPESLLGLGSLALLDLSRNNFGGEVQAIFGRFTQLKFLALHSNSFTYGLHSSGIFNLQNISRLDLSLNNFSGPLPVEISQMRGLQVLLLAHNQFSGYIPSQYANLSMLQILDLSFNRLNGSIPASLGNLSSLLWLMLANNALAGEIPPELGNCKSLLWLNLANNQLSGRFPSELTNIGLDPTPTFRENQQDDWVFTGSSECLGIKRWIPADYPPFNFVYTILTRKNCKSIWDRLLKGYGLFPLCINGSRTFRISGYVQLSGNQISGEVPSEIGKMRIFSMLNLGVNKFYGELPHEIGAMPLVVLNVSRNKFSGEIPSEIGDIQCLQNLDLSYNNFSGDFPASLHDLSELNNFNISYNPYITGEIPETGQLATFEKEAFLGDPLLKLPSFIKGSTDANPRANNSDSRQPTKVVSFLVLFALAMAFLIFGMMSIIVCHVVQGSADMPAGYLLEEAKGGRWEYGSSSSSGTSSSSWLSDAVKVIRLDKKAFTHSDILKATGNFSNERIIGRGGFGTVYRGVLPDGREVAVKKLQREGSEGEKEFQAEMEVMSGNGFGWPHPNLVTLYGWCLDGSEKLLVYEYMEGGSLEDLVSDRIRLTWRRRLDIAVDVARALVYLHHECFPAVVHRDVKASNVLLDREGKARVTDFGLARVVDAGDSHVSTMVAGTVGYVAPEYGQTWQATTKGDVYSFGVVAMELATGRRAVSGGGGGGDQEAECLVEWARRVMGRSSRRRMVPVAVLGVGLSGAGSGVGEGAEEMCELLRVGIRCTAELPQARPNMKEVLAMLIKISITISH